MTVPGDKAATTATQNMQPKLKYPDAVIMIFAKAPLPGQVNTRLVPFISARDAAELQAEFIHERARECVSAALCEVQLWCSPDNRHPCFVECGSRYPLTLHEQQGANLGERMAFGQRRALKSHGKAVIIGTDAPALKADVIEQAILALDQHDVVLVPAEDGGYVLIAVNTWFNGLLDDVEWGQGQVLAQTLRNVDSLGLSCDLLDECWDIDRPADLIRYRSMKSASSA